MLLTHAYLVPTVQYELQLRINDSDSMEIDLLHMSEDELDDEFKGKKINIKYVSCNQWIGHCHLNTCILRRKLTRAGTLPPQQRLPRG